MEDLAGLLEIQSKEFTVLDLSDNLISEKEVVDEILAKIPNLRVIYLNGNSCVRSISNYRKTLIAKISTLTYIDDRPIFDDERFALAFTRGGYEEERKERDLYRKEQREKEEKRITEFYNLMHKYKKEGEIKKEEESKLEEERERKKLDLLNKLKKKNEIFTGEEIESLPAIKSIKNLSESEKSKVEAVEVCISNEKEEKEENIPELEEVKNEEKKEENEDDNANCEGEEGMKVKIVEEDLDELD